MKKFNMNKLAIAVVAGAVWSGPTSAATETTSIAVSTNVAAQCSVSANPLVFGDYDAVTKSEVTGSTTIAVTCTDGAGVTLELGDGNHYDVDSRRLQNGTDNTSYLKYGLFSDTGHATPWGTGETADVDTTGTGAEEQHTVYGKIVAGQDAHVGEYSDTVTVTVTF